MGFDPVGDFMFSFGPIFMVIFFIIFIGIILVAIISSIGEWNKNNNSPKLTVPAEVITKRSETSGGSGDSSASTRYYTTFQVESGDRIEFPVTGSQYGMLAEGDLGMLTFQGTRYLEYKRVLND
ncbi:DUF2500 domain-containing protein [Sporosarcina sp. YIM B06819]|uniref:DUF2500 domain-containing protein n=1 Tax=Sporosarcina sp. YIM B06819 TaxID=3081769 RepID=UPI00298CA883|nr:DUF2500 domain-containing protein [Sporosarcina sp. YIM B06819]